MPVDPNKETSDEIAALKDEMNRRARDHRNDVQDYLGAIVIEKSRADEAEARLERLESILSCPEDLAARLWKAEAENSGTPSSLVEARTRSYFDEQSPELHARWMKFARAAIEFIKGEMK